ncbi:MAG: SBBP repeat-containing protein [Acidobacteria bacterium]|nr:SBBP repeat-containing protein [Acidobacteriota bacterium]
MGQADSRAKFLTRSASGTVFFTPKEATVLVRPTDHLASQANTPASVTQKQPAHIVQIQFKNAQSSTRLFGINQLSARSNYFIGNNRAQWKPDVPHFESICYQEIYPGIDLVFYGNQRHLEFDFQLSPGSNPQNIKLMFNGAQNLALNSNGDLVITTQSGQLLQQKPIVYQAINSQRTVVDGNYIILPSGEVGFQLGNYAPEYPLIIDPILSYATYLGGTGYDQCNDIAVDSSGNIVLTGYTTSLQFPFGNPTQSTHFPTDEVFVTKLNPTGTTLIYSVYLGGTNTNSSVTVDQGEAVAIDSTGNIYLTGETNSTDFPVTPGAIQPNLNGCCNSDIFITKLNAAGNQLLYSTYLGGDFGNEQGTDIAVDSAGAIYTVGFTNSLNFPITPGAFQTTGGVAQNGGIIDGFAVKLNPTTSSLIYGTYLGGANADKIEKMVLTSTGEILLVGDTNSPNFPTKPGAYQPIPNGSCCNYDAFVAKLNSNGTDLVFSTYLGGATGNDFGTGIGVDPTGNILVGGYTGSTDFPVTSGVIQPTGGVNPISGIYDGFVTRLNSSGSALAFSTYLGGNGTDQILDLTVDSIGNAHMAGLTASSNFPLVDPLQPEFGGGAYDGFVAEIGSTGTTLVHSTYLGGSGNEIPWSVCVDTSQTTLVGGTTTSVNFPTHTPYQASNQGGNDAFLVKISPCPTLDFQPSILPTGIIGLGYNQSLSVTGGQSPYTFTVLNGTLPAGLALSTIGVISGTPSAIGTSQFTVQVQEGNQCRGSQTYTLTISCPSISLSPTTLPGGASGSTYNQSLSASGGQQPYTFTISAGSLPAGLTLNPTGLISGIPLVAGTAQVSIQVQDAMGCVGSQTYPMAVTCPAATILPATLPTGTVGTTYTETLTVSGAQLPFTFDLVNGVLPTGVTLSPTGQISGLPTQGGNFSFTVRATSESCCTYLQPFTLEVEVVPTIDPTPDIGFNPGLNGEVVALGIQPDGKWVIGGSFTQVNGQPRAHIVRLNPDGSVDTSFADPGLNGTVRKLILLPDGKILIGGDFNQAGGFTRVQLARLNANGTADPTFQAPVLANGNGGFITFARQVDGKIVVGGGFSQAEGQPHAGLVRLTSNGGVDTTFNPQVLSPGFIPLVWTIALQSDGKIVIGGDFSLVNYEGRQNIARLNSNGTLDTTFTAYSTARVYVIAIQPDKKILVGGVMAVLSGHPVINLGRVHLNGSPDTGFQPAANASVHTMVVQTDGKILVGGFFNIANGDYRNYIMRLNSDGAADNTFIDPGLRGHVWGLGLEPNGRIVAGGGFTQVGSFNQKYLVRFASPSTPAQELLIAPNGTSVTWNRSGNGPDVWRTYFEVSTNGGTTYSLLGSGTRIGTSTNWQITGLNLPIGTSFLIRARGFTISGETNGSSGLIQQIQESTFGRTDLPRRENRSDAW